MLWDDIKFNNQTSLRIRLNTEPKYQMGPYYHMLKDNVDRRKFDQDEVVIDNLYLDIKRPFNLPLDLRIGRQDFLGPDTYGEGFLILDGTPGDGSRTFYFNALRARLFLSNKDSIDFVVLKQKERDVYLPSLHPSYDDKGVLYISHKKGLRPQMNLPSLLMEDLNPVQSYNLNLTIFTKRKKTLQQPQLLI